MHTDFLPLSRLRAGEVEAGRAESKGSPPTAGLGCAQGGQGDPVIRSVRTATAAPVSSFLTPSTLWKGMSTT